MGRAARGFGIVAAAALLVACSKSNQVNANTECTVDTECIDDGNPCTVEQCNEGTCAHPLAKDGTTTPDGTCWHGQQCAGCYNGRSCADGSRAVECGEKGAMCASCDDANECTTDTCDMQKCVHAPLIDATSCASGAGACRKGTCCQGCWDGAKCVAGMSDAAGCGKGGAACVSCDDANECTDDVCSAGACLKQPAVDQTTCTNGTCWSGACCKGCWNGQTCAAGTSVPECAAAGTLCKSCDDQNECTVDGCKAGACQNPNALPGTACPTGVCVANTCACGGAGQPCCAGATPCTSPMVCSNGTCGDCGAATQPCCAGMTCSAGNACANGFCAECGKMSEPCCDGSSCGTGLTCSASACVACGAVGEACCEGTACDGTSTVCVAGQCRHCGDNGEPCCEAGALCSSAALTCSGGSCVHCGDANEPCCTSGAACSSANTVCQSQTCSHCGGTNEPCCTATTPCSTSSLLCQTGSCHHCGALAETCCGASPTCGALMSCNAGECGGCATKVVAGGETECAIRSDATLWCWGHNGFCQTGSDPAITAQFVSVPAKISLSKAATAVAMGLRLGCAVLVDGSLVCWGNGQGGVFGAGTDGQKNPAPVVMPLPPGITAKRVGVSSFEATVCFVGSDDALYCLGSSTYGLLGIGTVSGAEHPTPAQVVTLGNDVADIAMGAGSACAILKNGTAWCWGENDHAQLGIGNTTRQTTPQQVVLLGNSVAQIGIGQTHACARKTDGTVSCWGEGDYVGNSSTSTTAVGSPVDLSNWLGADNVEIQVGDFTSCVRKSSGGVRCWGQFGTTSTYVPTAVDSSLVPATSVSTSPRNGCLVRSDLTVWCVGSNQYYQNGNTDSSTSLAFGTQAQLSCP